MSHYFALQNCQQSHVPEVETELQKIAGMTAILRETERGEFVVQAETTMSKADALAAIAIALAKLPIVAVPATYVSAVRVGS